MLIPQYEQTVLDWVKDIIIWQIENDVVIIYGSNMDAQVQFLSILKVY